MRLARISLATKYRLLFGLAVLLIIGAALAVPWFMLETLVLQQPFREAETIAETHFRLVMSDPDSVAGVHGGTFSLLPEKLSQQPRFISLEPNPSDTTSRPSPGVTDSFIKDARETFREHPNKKFYYQTVRNESGRRFRYAHAVWVTKGCLNCHAEGRSARSYRENQLAGIITVDLPAELSGQSALVNRVLMVTAGTLAGILAILVFYIITTRFILSPINELRSVALRVADGDLAVRSTVRTGDEFELLAVNINTMLERLRDSQDELKKANRLLDEKLGELAETNVALYEANRVKSEFLANVSHELRTPLTSIIGFAELLREDPPGQSDSRALRYAENILISGRILLEIINDLLDLAKIEAGRVELRIESVQVPEVCSTLLDFMRPQADNQKIQVQLEVGDALPALFTDRGRLRQILFNFLSNALKFTPEGGQVWLQAQRLDDTHVRVSVRDTGPGIPPEQHESIFEKFRQIDQSATREHHGTGLGLAIAKELTYLLGGEIGVDSEPGRGATFWLELPTTAPERRERPLISLV
ncbi:MAG: HAMP domain-containing protein [Phycisphaerae bacterium]|nr:HAMP domain-containing protein [Phycisphaerae bacterium]